MKQRVYVSEPSVLICQEKYGNRYFHIPDDQALFATALMILKGRVEEDCWYYEPEKPTECEFKEVPEGVKGTSLEAGIRRQIAACKRAADCYAADLEDWNNIRDAIEKKDGEVAWRVLVDHSDGEYEQVSLEEYSTTYDI